MQKSEHLQRMEVELAELRTKCAGLEAFLKGKVFKTLPNAERVRMNKQMIAMDDYVTVLQERVNHAE